jgi:hypothetical protein
MLLVLVEGNVWDEFRPAVESIGERWAAPSGRVYHLSLQGKRLEVWLEHRGLDHPPHHDLVDADLFALAGTIYDAVGGEWSSDALKQTAQTWGWTPG